MYGLLFRHLMDTDFFKKGCFLEENIFVLGGFEQRPTDEGFISVLEIVYRICMEQGANHCERGALFYENIYRKDGYDFRGRFDDLDKFYAAECFDRVIVLCGLELEGNPLGALAQIRRLVKVGGRIDLLLRTSESLHVKYNIREYEHKWRFSVADIKKIFSEDDLVKQAITSNNDFIVLEIGKKIANDSMDIQMPLFSCKLREYARPKDLAVSGYFHDYEILNAIGDLYDTDKNQYYHNYLDKYEFFLHALRDKSFNLLELGIFRGGSAQLWEKYFTRAMIHCVDILPECAQFATERIITHIMDLGEVDNLVKLRELKPEVIIDDASHWWSHQILALFTLFPALPSGGIYILEDLETSLNQNIYPDFAHGSMIDAYTVCERIAKVVASKVPEKEQDEISCNISMIGLNTEMVSIIKGSCIFIKR